MWTTVLTVENAHFAKDNLPIRIRGMSAIFPETEPIPKYFFQTRECYDTVNCGIDLLVANTVSSRVFLIVSDANLNIFDVIWKMI